MHHGTVVCMFSTLTASYTITESLNRVSDEHEASAWLDVSKNKDVISSMDCYIDYGSLSDID